MKKAVSGWKPVLGRALAMEWMSGINFLRGRYRMVTTHHSIRMVNVPHFNAFEMWCYQRMLRISWTSHTTNIDVLQKIGVKETSILNTLKNKKVVLCGPHNEEHIRTS